MPGKKRALVAAWLWIMAALTVHAQSAAENRFAWNEANAAFASAKHADDFRHAAATYQSLVDSGVRNGPLFLNLGIAFLNAGMYGDAIEAFLRAERYVGSNQDIKRNMQIARARLAKTGFVPEPWYRVIFFWHYGLAASRRALIAVVAFAAFWLLLAARVLGIKRLCRPLAIAAFIVFAIFGSSVLTSVYQELQAPLPIFAHVPPPAQ